MKIIDTTDALAELCEDYASSPYVTVDTEFLRESTFWPILCLIQIARDGDEAIIDPMAEGIDLAPFFELMADESVVKVFHAARQDIEIFVHLDGRVPSPLFDTQVAAMVCGYGDSIAY
ncbi:MAG: ribonuclease D, partial [Pseudomonadota bacterium]